MKIALVSSEVAPFSKTGGLADVSGALPRALERLGHDVQVITPFYRCVARQGGEAGPAEGSFSVTVGERRLKGEILRGTLPRSEVPVVFLRQDECFDREGLYGMNGQDHSDNASRFVFFSRAALEVMKTLGTQPDVVHVHDWQSALVAIYMRTLYQDEFARSRCVLTVHNLAYQGLFWHWDMKLTGLDWKHFNWLEMEFYGKLNFLKAGLVHADALTTVSPAYAREIQEEGAGCGLHGVLRHRARHLRGILNGVDYEEWNPEGDRHIPHRYSARSLEGKGRCKTALREELGLAPAKDGLVIGFVGRLAEQKGIDILLPVLDRLAKDGIQSVLLGTGDASYESAARRLAAAHPGRVAVQIGFDEGLAHRIEAGADVFVMPSRFEPCGLNQIYGMKYGTLPVVRATGGLKDTVADGKTGFVFEEYAPEALERAIRRALEEFGDRRGWRAMVNAAMKQDFSWDASARRYTELFEELGAQRKNRDSDALLRGAAQRS